MKTKDNYYRVILKTFGYSKLVLDSMSDEECESEYEAIPNNQ